VNRRASADQLEGPQNLTQVGQGDRQGKAVTFDDPAVTSGMRGPSLRRRRTTAEIVLAGGAKLSVGLEGPPRVDCAGSTLIRYSTAGGAELEAGYLPAPGTGNARSAGRVAPNADCK
jgi:hypothetical protein